MMRTMGRRLGRRRKLMRSLKETLSAHEEHTGFGSRVLRHY